MNDHPKWFHVIRGEQPPRPSGAPVTAPYNAKVEAEITLNALDELKRTAHPHELALRQHASIAAALEAARAAGREDAASLFATHEGSRESITAALEAARAAGVEEAAAFVEAIVPGNELKRASLKAVAEGIRALNTGDRT